tara:strand:+ start:1665 stop:2735 length:1071 start_codon:yes stop_codon:yes gene_type:complete
MGIRSLSDPSSDYNDKWASTGLEAATGAPPGLVEGTGGDVTAGVAPGNGYRYHLWSTPGNFVVTFGGEIEFLVIGGGGGAAFGFGAGGGAGGVRTNDPAAPTDLKITTQLLVYGGDTIPVSIGEGGSGSNVTWPAPTEGPNNARGNSGGSTSFGDPGDAWYITSSGGGYGTQGQTDNRAGGPGGSGGGAGFESPGNPYGGTSNNAGDELSPEIQGYPGGGGQTPGWQSGSGGGGGAGGTGSKGGGSGGAGGPGVTLPAFSYPLIEPIVPGPKQPEVGPVIGPTGVWAGGGAGGPGNQSPPGGGGSAIASTPAPGPEYQDGVPMMGGGGGGTGPVNARPNESGGAGGDGVVIIRYQV